MAKTESTAVNQLIDQVQKNESSDSSSSEPATDLFSEVPTTTMVNPPRVTQTVPHMKGAGEVAPLPRGRAPHSTSEQLSIRVSTAEFSRGNTIPPLSRPSTKMAVPPSTRRSDPSLPPPRPSPRDVSRPSPAPPAPPASRSSAPPPEASPSSTLSWGGAPPVPAPRMPPPSDPAVPASMRPSSPPPPPRNTPKATLPPRASTLAGPPPLSPVAAPFQTPLKVPQQYPIVRTSVRASSVDMTGDVLRTDTWFDISTRLPRPDETWVGTAPMPRQRPEAFALVKKLIVPTVVLAVVGILVGGYIAFSGEGGKRKPAKAPTIAAAPSVVAAPVAPAAHPEPLATPSTESPNAATASAGGVQPQPPTKEEAAAKQAAVTAAELGTHPGGGAPTAATATGASAPPAGLPASTAVREIRTPQGVLTFVDVRIDSKPAGATVMLVDNGKTSFLGTTPISTSLDPSRGYDVILSLSGRPTQMAHLDPTKQSRLEVVLGKPMPQVRPEKAVAATELKVETPAKAEPAAKPESAAPSAAATEPASKPEAHHHHHTAPVEAKSETTDKPSDAAGQGELMVSSKPPCEIWIDGKSTGLTTPQKSIPLAVGTHKVTFVNEAENIKKTVSISITADQPTKLIQDLMKK